MNFRFQDEDLEQLAFCSDVTGGFPAAVVRAFRKRIQMIRDAPNERDLYAFQSWRFKKLKGARAHQRSIRLNDRWRLIVEIEPSRPSNVLVIVAIEDYH